MKDVGFIVLADRQTSDWMVKTRARLNEFYRLQGRDYTPHLLSCYNTINGYVWTLDDGSAWYGIEGKADLYTQELMWYQVMVPKQQRGGVSLYLNKHANLDQVLILGAAGRKRKGEHESLYYPKIQHKSGWSVSIDLSFFNAGMHVKDINVIMHPYLVDCMAGFEVMVTNRDGEVLIYKLDLSQTGDLDAVALASDWQLI